MIIIFRGGVKVIFLSFSFGSSIKSDGWVHTTSLLGQIVIYASHGCHIGSRSRDHLQPIISHRSRKLFSVWVILTMWWFLCDNRALCFIWPDLWSCQFVRMAAGMDYCKLRRETCGDQIAVPTSYEQISWVTFCRSIQSTHQMKRNERGWYKYR